jgi:hypothetical protein
MPEPNSPKATPVQERAPGPTAQALSLRSTMSLLYTSVAGLALNSGQRLASTQGLNVSPRRQATTPRVRCGGKGDPSAVGGRGNPSAGLRAIEKLAAECSQHVGDLLGALDGASGIRSEAMAQ